MHVRYGTLFKYLKDLQTMGAGMIMNITKPLPLAQSCFYADPVPALHQANTMQQQLSKIKVIFITLI